MTRRAAALLAAVVLVGAHPKPPPPIDIVINGIALPVQPPPLLDRGILLVPVRRTIEALGFDFSVHGSQMTMLVGAKTVVLRDGSRTALVDGEPVTLDAPAVRRHGVFYVPLRFFTAVLGAEATFDRKGHVVSIVAELVGRSRSGVFTVGNRSVHVGTVTAVDVDSDPPTVTLSFNGVVNTIAISKNAIVTMRDVGVNVDAPGELADIRPGDYAQITARSNGAVSSVVDEYGSRYGEIAVANPDELLMQDGHVVVPDRDTIVDLNGAPAQFTDLQAGDRVSIRYNVETFEVREIDAEREAAPTSAQNGSASITDVSIDATRALRAGQRVTVVVHGSPGGGATFAVGAYVQGIAMSERAPGTYVGRYDIGRDANFADAPIVARLRMPDGSVAEARAARSLSASSQPPGITSIGPDDGTAVDLQTPAIYATFASEAVDVNPSSIRLIVNGRDVTSECTRSAQLVQYLPREPFRNGTVHVVLRVADDAGNAATKSWTFTIR